MTKRLLVLNASLREDGHSRDLVSHFVEHWQHQGGTLVSRDFAQSAVPHLNVLAIQALTQGQCENDYQKEILALSDLLIAELKEANAVVIGMPLYNLAAPSVFQSYMDYVLRSGITFKYTPEGPVGLLEDKPIYILCARGGIFTGINAHLDTQTQWIKNIFGLAGLSCLRFIYAESLSMGDTLATASLSQAKEEISALFDCCAA